jgi:5-methyltetrahydropteroyltriglutamate--homocysteine methyltransferase
MGRGDRRSLTIARLGAKWVGSAAVRAFVPGIYPRSEALVQATRDLDRGRTTPEAVEEQLARDLQELVRLQQEAGLDLLADGMLPWQDPFRPLLEASEGLEPGALTRFLDTNTFYRAPHASTAEPRLREPLGGRHLAPLPGPRLVTLPSPWAFAQGTGLTPRVVASGILGPQLQALGPEIELVVLAEPFFARAPGARLEDLSTALEALGGARPLALQFVFCDARPALELGLGELPVDAIGVDFYLTRALDVPEGLGKTLLAGVVDARSSVLEDVQELAAFAGQLRDRVEDVALVPNGDLQFVAEPIAREKIARLGQARYALAEAA